MERDTKVYVAGHRGLVGSAIVRALERSGFKNLVTRTKTELDLTDRRRVESFFTQERPSLVFLAAAKVGGILANDTFSADFIRENLLIQTHVIDAPYRSGAKKLAFLAPSSIY